jgi:hypothetical protein
MQNNATTHIANNSADALVESSVNELQVEDYGLLDQGKVGERWPPA